MLSPQPILDGELLRAFAAFAETLSFTHAARKVHLSQPALFERVRRLADELGITLYEKAGRELRLTEQGTRLAAFARELLARSAQFTGELRGELEDPQLTFAAGEGAYVYLLGPVLERFRAGERATLRLLTLGAPSACAAVQSGEAQLAFGVVDLLPRGLVARDVLVTPLCAAMSRRHPLAKKKTITLAELAGEQLILAPPGRQQRELVGRAVASLGRAALPPIEADGWPLMLEFAAANLGVAVVNGIVKPPARVVLRPIPELGTVTYRTISRRGAPRSHALERLEEMIVAAGAKFQTMRS